MNVLAFDTTASSCSIAVLQNKKPLAEKQKSIERGHAEFLVPLIEETLLEAKLSYRDLDLLAVTTGPGAFTGIRIGLATARSLAIACNLPLIGITNFDAIVNGISETERKGRKILVILETKRLDFYVCLYNEDLSILIEPQTVEGSYLKMLVKDVALIVVGDAKKRALPFLAFPEVKIIESTSVPYVNPAIVAKLAESILVSGVDIYKPLPFYLKAPDVMPANIPSRF